MRLTFEQPSSGSNSANFKESAWRTRGLFEKACPLIPNLLGYRQRRVETTSEREYEQKRGLKSFMQALDKHDVPTIVDMNRKPFA